jgi:hypothetical protein
VQHPKVSLISTRLRGNLKSRQLDHVELLLGVLRARPYESVCRAFRTGLGNLHEARLLLEDNVNLGSTVVQQREEAIFGTRCCNTVTSDHITKKMT